jgi:hypothetical protein
MDFIERLFAISPDAGSGAFEFILLGFPVLILVALTAYRRFLASIE